MNGEFGYRWQPGDAPSVRPVHAPKIQDDEVLLFDEPGRCGGLDCHSHHFRVVRRLGSYSLLVAHGAGEERLRLFSMAPDLLASIAPDQRYWLLHTIYTAHANGARDASDREASTWRRAAAEGRLKKRKQRGKDTVKVWIEPRASR